MHPHSKGSQAPRPDRPPPSYFSARVASVVPSDLRSRPQWILWMRVWRNGKATKIPVDPATRKPIDATDARHWMSFDEALRLARELGLGIGFAIGPEGSAGLVALDFDDCIDDRGNIDPAVRRWIDEFGCYWEVTPSDRGIRIWLKGTIVGSKRKHTRRKIELYSGQRFMTFTGNRPDDSHPSVERRQEALDALYRELFDKSGKLPELSTADSRANGQADASDDELIEKARQSKNGARFTALFDRGDVSLYGDDHSAADMALMNDLAYWLNRDAGRMEAAFGRSALGRREKWTERSDYRKRTIDEAIAGCREVYTAAHPPGSNGCADPDARLAKVLRTDTGNGERMATRHGRAIRYCHPWSKWLHYDGRRWKIDDDASVRRLAKATARKILAEAATIDDPDVRKQHAKWALRSESGSGINCMLTEAAAELGVPILPADMDRDPWLFNCLNGTVDLRTGQLRPHRREDLITSLAPVQYRELAKCSTWITALDRIFERNPNLIGFVNRLFGMALTGDVSEQVLPIFHGCGANGKTTLLTAILEIMGDDYAMMAPPGLLLMRRGEPHPTERALLHNKRLIVDMESAEGARLNEAWVKQLTGSDQITARRMREDFWKFSPTHKIIMGTNHKPDIRETKNAIWRRVKLVPFTVSIPEEEQIRDLPKRLRAEYPGILAWAVRGCQHWQRDGLNPPKEVVDATAEYRAEQDLLAEFLADECKVNLELKDQLKAKVSLLYERYHGRVGAEAMNQTAFGRALAERGFERYSNNGIWYRGLGLLPRIEAKVAEQY